MTQEEKFLLLQDLSARLLHGVIVKLDDKFKFNKGDRVLVKDLLDLSCVEGIKPYLRSLSSMTEEERIEYKHLVAFSGSPNGAANFVDWLNKKMFVYRTIDGKDMFELGLALEAPKGMYNINEK